MDFWICIVESFTSVSNHCISKMLQVPLKKILTFKLKIEVTYL